MAYKFRSVGNMVKKEAGVRRTFWLPNELDDKAEQARQILGLGRSGFYKFAVIEVIKQLQTNGAKA